MRAGQELAAALAPPEDLPPDDEPEDDDPEDVPPEDDDPPEDDPEEDDPEEDDSDEEDDDESLEAVESAFFAGVSAPFAFSAPTAPARESLR